MGMYDTIMLNCPNCGQEYGAQTKSGRCALRVFQLQDALQDDAIWDVNRHAPFQCLCGVRFEVRLELDERTGQVVSAATEPTWEQQNNIFGGAGIPKSQEVPEAPYDDEEVSPLETLRKIRRLVDEVIESYERS